MLILKNKAIVDLWVDTVCERWEFLLLHNNISLYR